MYKRNENEKNSSNRSKLANERPFSSKSQPKNSSNGTNEGRSFNINKNNVALNNKLNAASSSSMPPYMKEKSSLKALPQSQNGNNNNSSKQRRSIARERWDILRKAILNKNGAIKSSNHSSVRRFDSFGFIKSVKIAYTDRSIKRNVDEEDDYYDDNNNKANSRYTSRNSHYTNNTNEEEDDEDICYRSSRTHRSKSEISVRKTSRKRSTNRAANNEEDHFQWFLISVPSIDSQELVKARFYNGPVSLNEMVGFNNTGNICLWPSEEIMTYFCVKNSAIFDNKSVCELGGGMTCLGGLMISKCSKPREVFLTDGNETSFENLEVICSENEFECSVECCLLQWDKDTNYGDLEERFDYILCADCLFFDEYRDHLCATIYKLLKTDGMCLIFAPNRQNTFHKFVDMAKLHFECMIVHDYDMDVWEKHLYEKEHNDDYDEDIHYPLLLKLKKRTRTNNDFCKMVL